MGIISNAVEGAADTVEGAAEAAGSGGGLGCLGGLVFVFAICSLIFSGIKKYVNNLMGERGGYVTLIQPLKEYKKIEDSPMGKEIGSLQINTVLRLKTVSKKSNLTWIYAYILKDEDKVETVYVCIPEKIDVEEENPYVSYNEKSRSWNAYYQRIDKKNKPIFEKNQAEFNKAISNINISKGSDNIVKESIKETSWILDASGYMDLYVATGNDFYYINKNQKSAFLKEYKKYQKKYEDEKIKYFN